MKYADVIPIHKKDDKTDKENYRPISILPNLSKVYERLMYNQSYPYFEKLFPKFQCWFWKGFNAQHCLLAMTEKWRETLDKCGEAGAVLTYLSEEFDCIDQNLFMEKLDAYWLSTDFLHWYLKKCKQRTKVDSAYSLWEMLLSGFPQGSISRPLRCNIYISKMFCETPKNIDFTGYADKKILTNVKEVIENLQRALKQLFQWFSANHLVANAKKVTFLLVSK